MRGMLVKDIRLMARQKLFFGLLLFIAVTLNFSSEGIFVVGYLTFVSTFFVISTISYDEHANGLAFLMTLPVIRKTYVREKYIFGLLLGGCGWGASVIISAINLICSGERFFDIINFLSEAVFLIPTYVLVLALMIPFPIKFGVEGGRIAIIIFVGIAVCIGYFFTRYEWLADSVVMVINNWLPTDPWNLMFLFLFASIVAVCISCAMSCRIMSKKEF